MIVAYTNGWVYKIRDTFETLPCWRREEIRREDMHCDQCEMLSINGVACHETGCPNSHSRWNAAEQCWVKQYECVECGSMTDVGDVCCTNEPLEEEPERFCIVDGQYGIYVPTRFASKFRYNQSYVVLHVTPADWDELERGPDVDGDWDELERGLDVDGYWDLWDEICRDAEIIDQASGKHFTLEQDGDLFMVQQS